MTILKFCYGLGVKIYSQFSMGLPTPFEIRHFSPFFLTRCQPVNQILRVITKICSLLYSIQWLCTERFPESFRVPCGEFRVKNHNFSLFPHKMITSEPNLSVMAHISQLTEFHSTVLHRTLTQKFQGPLQRVFKQKFDIV
jgi:hypothetical protein